LAKWIVKSCRSRTSGQALPRDTVPIDDRRLQRADQVRQVTPFAAEIRPGVDITKINRLLADWEDEEILRKLELGK
jgi:hypothetical protein